VRAPPASATLMDALGLVGEDLRCHGTCAPAAMAGVCDTPDNDGRRIDSEGASGAGDWDVGERRR
jgi:hypothetical protein